MSPAHTIEGAGFTVLLGKTQPPDQGERRTWVFKDSSSVRVWVSRKREARIYTRERERGTYQK